MYPCGGQRTASGRGPQLPSCLRQSSFFFGGGAAFDNLSGPQLLGIFLLTVGVVGSKEHQST